MLSSAQRGRAASEWAQMGPATAAGSGEGGREGLGHPAPSPSLTSAGGGLLAEVMTCCFLLSSIFSNASVIQRPTAKGNGIPYEGTAHDFIASP